MSRRFVLVVVLTLALAGLLGGCRDGAAQAPAPGGEQTGGASAPDSAASGSQLAAGLHEGEDGKAQAVGTLEWRDLEGGFWVITSGGAAGAGGSETVAVIANGAAFQRKLEALKGRRVIATGKRLTGASARMAGPEIEIESVQAADGGSGPAE